ncbi:uncharacterized protein N7482_003104 [Penicillium canariense]|uniref:Uncharacterized protein n=1 Tax=Penicillium canariense TaxID=189055 RepID=A0A9W9LVS0_9EURO|nr:uncharacterized protein N7482_003104 [Penicillium canariense]KAJ5177227.1 hypothetical protein N7482_003104 [Penicillium canariense]
MAFKGDAHPDAHVYANPVSNVLQQAGKASQRLLSMMSKKARRWFKARSRRKYGMPPGWEPVSRQGRSNLARRRTPSPEPSSQRVNRSRRSVHPQDGRRVRFRLPNPDLSPSSSTVDQQSTIPPSLLRSNPSLVNIELEWQSALNAAGHQGQDSSPSFARWTELTAEIESMLGSSADSESQAEAFDSFSPRALSQDYPHALEMHLTPPGTPPPISNSGSPARRARTDVIYRLTFLTFLPLSPLTTDMCRFEMDRPMSEELSDSQSRPLSPLGTIVENQPSDSLDATKEHSHGFPSRSTPISPEDSSSSNTPTSRSRRLDDDCGSVHNTEISLRYILDTGLVAQSRRKKRKSSHEDV